MDVTVVKLKRGSEDGGDHDASAYAWRPASSDSGVGTGTTGLGGLFKLPPSLPVRRQPRAERDYGDSENLFENFGRNLKQ